MEQDLTRDGWTSLVLLERFRTGDDSAADAIYVRYFERLTSLARSLLSARLASRIDPEDAVLSAYRSFFVSARSGRFTLTRGGDLWRLLASITKHKLLRQSRQHTADRRSVNREVPLGPAEEQSALDRTPEGTPEDAIALADELEWIFSQLSALGKRVLELRLQGAELAAIAADTGRSERTVRRTLTQIRELMSERLADDQR